jgi:hypothetical protein
LFLLGAVQLPPAGWWYVHASAWLLAAQLIAILGILSGVAWWLHRSGRLLRL